MGSLRLFSYLPVGRQRERLELVRRLAIFACVFAALLPVVSAHGDSTDPATVGQWGPVMQWPLVAVHANLLSNGQVLVWDGFEAGPNSERLFDPNTLALTPRPYARNLFCSGYAQLADGKLFIAGGHVTVNNGLKDATLWDPTTNTAQRLPDLTNSRWYPTVTTLSDGRVMVFSGDNIQSDDSPPGNPLSFVSHTLPEVYNPNTNSYTQLTGARVDTPLYPLMFAAPDGRVFQAGPDRQTHFVTTSGTGAVVNGPRQPDRAALRRHVRTREDRHVGHLVGPVFREPHGHRPHNGHRPQPAEPNVARNRADGLPALLPHADELARRQRDRNGRPDEL